MGIAVSADLSDFARKLEWMASVLEAGDVRERLDSGLLGRLHDTIFAGRGEELCKFGAVSAVGADKLTINIEAGGLLQELEVALWTLGFKFDEHCLSP